MAEEKRGAISASAGLKRAISRRVASGSPQRVMDSPSGKGVKVHSSGMTWYPCRVSSSSRMICGRNKLTT